MENKLITVICPVFNEEESIPIFYERFNRAVAPLRWTIASNSCSPTIARKTEHCKSSANCAPKIPPSRATFSRNFGYQVPVSGACVMRRRAIVLIDVIAKSPR